MFLFQTSFCCCGSSCFLCHVSTWMRPSKRRTNLAPCVCSNTQAPNDLFVFRPVLLRPQMAGLVAAV